MNASEYREKTTEQLEIEYMELKKELFKLRFNHATSKLENTSEIRRVKKDIARIKTIIREMELGIRDTNS
jgi:large subunit ribosomal protein L29